MPEEPVETVVLAVRAGRMPPQSWVYAWVRVADGLVVYVGATWLPPQVRTWLHLNDPDPAVGRVRARYADVDADEFEVVAARVPDGCDRAAARSDLVRRLEDAGLLAPDYVGGPSGEVPGGQPSEGGVAVNELVRQVWAITGD